VERRCLRRRRWRRVRRALRGPRRSRLATPASRSRPPTTPRRPPAGVPAPPPSPPGFKRISFRKIKLLFLRTKELRRWAGLKKLAGLDPSGPNLKTVELLFIILKKIKIKISKKIRSNSKVTGEFFIYKI
jgi:hypothetical protein